MYGLVSNTKIKQSNTKIKQSNTKIKQSNTKIKQTRHTHVWSCIKYQRIRIQLPAEYEVHRRNVHIVDANLTFVCTCA